MSGQKINLNKEILTLFSGQSSQVTIPKLYIELTGTHSLALVLSQCVFWSNKSECKDGFFYKTYAEWFEEIHIPERTLRRLFEKLETDAFITTKIKKVHGLNIKHFRPDMDKIIESISSILNQDCPNIHKPDPGAKNEHSTLPKWPVGAENEQKTCTKVAPAGQTGRLEPANLADSSITEDYEQKKLTNCKTSENPSSSSFFNQVEKEELLRFKCESDARSDEEFLTHCEYHIENQKNDHSRFQRFCGLKKILRRLEENEEHFKAKGLSQNNGQSPEAGKLSPNAVKRKFTDEEKKMAEDYHYGFHSRNMRRYFSSDSEIAAAEVLHRKIYPAFYVNQ